MKLPFEDGLLFYKLYPALLRYVNQKLEVVDDIPTDSEQYVAVPGELRLKVRDALFAHRELIDDFIRENPAHLAPNELAVVADWKHAVTGSLYVFRYLTKYTIFLEDRSSPKAFGVLAIADPFQELVGPNLPVLTQAVLLPFLSITKIVAAVNGCPQLATRV